MEGKRTLGIKLLVSLNAIFGSIGIAFGLLSGSLYQLTLSLMLLISAVGLFKLKSWGWWLAVLGCIISIIGYIFTTLQGFPLETVILPYLLLKMKTFGIKIRRKCDSP
jgi:uncharacterized membrane protein (DUF2068 family)